MHIFTLTRQSTWVLAHTFVDAHKARRECCWPGANGLGVLLFKEHTDSNSHAADHFIGPCAQGGHEVGERQDTAELRCVEVDRSLARERIAAETIMTHYAIVASIEQQRADLIVCEECVEHLDRLYPLVFFVEHVLLREELSPQIWQMSFYLCRHGIERVQTCSSLSYPVWALTAMYEPASILCFFITKISLLINYERGGTGTNLYRVSTY